MLLAIYCARLLHWGPERKKKRSENGSFGKIGPLKYVFNFNNLISLYETIKYK